MKSLLKLFLVAALIAVTGCETIAEKRKIDYKSTRTLPPLEVPPDLTTLPGDKELPTAATYSGYAEQKARPAGAGDAAVLPEFSDMRIVRDEHHRWLAVKASPETLWPRVREFVLHSGLLIARENPQTGVLETEWAENRAKVGTAGQMVLAKWLATFYSTGTRDMFRIRLERGAQPGTAEIYLSHRGMEEVLTEASATGVGETRWRARAPEPEIEAEMLRLLMVHLGATESQAKLAAAAAPEKNEARAALTRSGEGLAFLNLQDSLDRAWRRVGLSLDRIGFTVEDRDRSKGIYYVRYIDPEKDSERPGFFSRMFGAGKDKTPSEQYQIYLKTATQGTSVEVLSKDGAPESSKTGERILSLLYEQLK